MTQKNKYKEPVKIDIDLSFDEAMERMLSANPVEVDTKVKDVVEQKLLTAPTSKKLLPRPKK